MFGLPAPLVWIAAIVVPIAIVFALYNVERDRAERAASQIAELRRELEHVRSEAETLRTRLRLEAEAERRIAEAAAAQERRLVDAMREARRVHELDVDPCTFDRRRLSELLALEAVVRAFENGRKDEHAR